jgi:hypothetical protein
METYDGIRPETGKERRVAYRTGIACVIRAPGVGIYRSGDIHATALHKKVMRDFMGGRIADGAPNSHKEVLTLLKDRSFILLVTNRDV